MAGMRIVEPRTMSRGLTPLAPPDAPEPAPQNWLPSVGAFGRIDPGLLMSAFGYDNDVTAAADLLSRPQYKPVPGYSALPDIQGTRYEELYLDHFIGVESPDETRDIKARLDREEAYRQNLAAGGWRGMVASMAAGVVSPTSLIPVAGWIVKGGKGASIAARSAEGALMVGSTVALQEGVLQMAQESRSAEESAFAVVMGAAVGAVLGPLVKGRAELDAVTRQMQDYPATVAEEGVAWQKAVSAGAAATDAARGSGELAGSMGVAEAVRFQDPLLRLQTSPFVSARNAIRDLAETPLTLAENAEGIATTIGGAVETRIKMARAPLASALSDVDSLYSRYFFGKQTSFAPARGTASVLMGRGGGKLSYSQFKEAIGEAMWSGDVHAIPEVAEAARDLRARVFDPLKKEAIEAGLLDEGVKALDDTSYLHRMYLFDVIRARRTDFTGILARHFEAIQSGVLRRIDALTKKVEEKQFEIDLTKSNVEEELARFRARQAELQVTRAAGAGEAAGVGRDLRAATGALGKEERAADRARRGQYRQLLADLRRGRPSERYSDLNAFIRGKGGIRVARQDATGGTKFKTAFGAEIQQAVGKGGRGIIRADGLDPDAMLRLAIDEGYLRPEADLNDLVSAIDDTLKGSPVYSQFDEAAVQRAGQIREMLAEIDRMGVDVQNLTPDDLARVLGDTSRPITPAVAKLTKEIEEIAARFDEATIKVEDIDRLADDLKEMAPDLVEAARAGREAGRQAAGELRALQRQIADAQSFADMSPAEIKSIVEEITDTILGNSPSRMLTPADIVQGPRGPLKERVLRIPTALIRDFVEKDVEVVARRYTDTMAADIGMVKKFGSTDLVDQIAKINDEANAQIAATTGEKAKAKIDAQRREAIRDLAAVRDRLRLNYAIPDNPDGLLVRAGRVARNLNYVRLLGGMTLSAVPDLAKPVMVYGLTRTMRTAFTPMVRGLKTLKLSAKEVKLAGTALDMSLDSRAMGIADIMDDYGRGSKFERALQAGTQKFGLVSLMAPWNAAIKQFVGIIAQTKILQSVERVVAGKASRKEIEYLAANGIDANMADRIWQQFDGAGVRDGAVWWANTEGWTDRQAVEAIRAALVRDVDRVIVTPGQDKPLWMSTEMGKLIGQFRSFNIASTQRTLISGLQQRDAAAFSGMMMMLGLGALSYYLKMEVGGFEVSADPAVWATEAFDRSGLAGWIGDANNMVEKMTRGHIGLSAFTGEQASRYASRNALGALLGPTFDQVGDAIQITGSAFAGDWTASDSRAFRKLVPLQNLFYIRSLFDKVEAGANQALGIPQRAGGSGSPARSMIR